MDTDGKAKESAGRRGRPTKTQLRCGQVARAPIDEPLGDLEFDLAAELAPDDSALALEFESDDSGELSGGSIMSDPSNRSDSNDLSDRSDKLPGPAVPAGPGNGRGRSAGGRRPRGAKG